MQVVKPQRTKKICSGKVRAAIVISKVAGEKSQIRIDHQYKCRKGGAKPHGKGKKVEGWF
jgi:hypothetical protein